MNELPPLPGKVVLREAEAAAWTDGYQFLAQARQASERVEARIAREVAAAQAAGFAAGQREGEAEAAMRVAAAVASVDTYLAGLERELADLVLDTVRRVLTAYDNVTLVEQLAREALREFRDARALTLHVSPGQVAALAARFADCDASSGPTVQVCMDARLQDDEGVLSSDIASMRLDVAQQIDRLRTVLYGVHR